MTGGFGSGDQRGEALPVAILFLGVFFTILIGIHVVLAAMARTAVQAAADAALAAAQSAGPGDSDQDCDGDPATTETVRQCEGVLAARITMVGASGSVIETRPPYISVEQERGLVTATVFGGTITPVLGGLEFVGQACGPLDDVPPSQLTGNNLWQC